MKIWLELTVNVEMQFAFDVDIDAQFLPLYFLSFIFWLIFTLSLSGLLIFASLFMMIVFQEIL